MYYALFVFDVVVVVVVVVVVLNPLGYDNPCLNSIKLFSLWVYISWQLYNCFMCLNHQLQRIGWARGGLRSPRRKAKAAGSIRNVHNWPRKPARNRSELNPISFPNPSRNRHSRSTTGQEEVFSSLKRFFSICWNPPPPVLCSSHATATLTLPLPFPLPLRLQPCLLPLLLLLLLLCKTINKIKSEINNKKKRNDRNNNNNTSSSSSRGRQKTNNNKNK